MKFGSASEAEPPLEPVIEEVPIEGHEHLREKILQEGRMKFDRVQGGGMKFGHVHDLPSASKAELHLELTTKKAPIKEYEVLPTKVEVKFGTSKAELTLEYVINETPYKEFTGGGMKFGQAKSSSTSSSSSRKSRQKK
ncbi:hypothetical protein COCNU_05G010750 [Cocos nucifera]|uniref:Uncharacterized protein n=1 Tax=Cocos nucifera TaxID=13894 RepID=A0A8K0IAB8_COCNU|nr:hypothetical protein COCNU_05G010750 [Cocos nucifera]